MSNPNEQTTPKILESERRRANNQIWNAAGMYDFKPELRAYDRDGNAELYWNSVIGAVQKHYGSDLDSLWLYVHKAMAEEVCELLVWLGLEHACYERESKLRPAFPFLRQSYARRILTEPMPKLAEPYLTVYRLYFQQAANLPIDPKDLEEPAVEKMLNQLKFSGELNGKELANTAYAFLDDWTLLIPKMEFTSSNHRFHIPFLKKRKGKGTIPELPKLRNFGSGLGEHGDPTLEAPKITGKHNIFDMTERKSDEHIANYIRDRFGTPLFSREESERLDRTFCTGDHENTHLHFNIEDGTIKPGISGYAYNVRRDSLKEMKQNLAWYQENREITETAIRILTEKWRNAVLTYRQDYPVKGAYGRLRADRIWRSEVVSDDRIFDHLILSDQGDFSVDILLDASYSQKDRQKQISLQAYIIAESLTRCNIPVRVSSFCTLSGYTVISQYRDYHETNLNQRIFNYTTAGCNRDGLALKLIGHLMERETDSAEHRVLILLSDARPKDIIYIKSGDEYVPYEKEASVENTSKEIRLLKNKGIEVRCIFTGDDEDVPHAQKIYGRDFVRIRSLNSFAQAVGNLILTQIRETV